MRRVLTERLQIEPRASSALDVGSGGGLLAEECARLGFRVTGIDPSAESVAAARAHAADAGLEIEYTVGTGERLPFADACSTSRTAATCSSTSTTSTVCSPRPPVC